MGPPYAQTSMTETLTPSVSSGHIPGPRPEAEQLAPGARLGDFEIIEEVGRGGGGRVYLARDLILDRLVALKRLRRDLIDASRLQAFLHEAKTTARFRHPHVVMVHSAHQYQNVPYLVLEYLEGDSLRTRLKDGPLPPTEAMSIGLAVARVLGAAHARGILHCDLKPENIVFTQDNTPKVVDFGLTAAIGDPVRRRLVGTPAYMSPEQWRQAPLMPPVDIWALSVLLYEMITGHRPYERADAASLPPPLHHPDIPPPLMALIESGLSQDAEHRPDARVFEATLDGLLTETQLLEALKGEEDLLGRAPERARLDAALSRLQQGIGSVIYVEGDAGLGKSLLLADFVTRSRSQGALVLTGAAETLTQGVPYSPWRRVVTELLCDAHMPSVEQIRHGLESRVPPALQHLLPLFNAVMPLGLEENQSTRPLRGNARADITTRFLADLVHALCPGPGVFVLDDCHWMDTASWRLVRQLAERMPHALIVIFTRPMRPTPEEVQALKALPHLEPITLPPLSPDIIRQLVASRLGDAPGASKVADRVVKRADGNPLFAEALLEVVQPGDSEDPLTVSQAIKLHIRGLPPVAERVLKQASIVGPRFSRLFLASVYHSPGELGPGLEALLKARLLVPTSGDELAFYHAITREAAYGLLGPNERTQGHRAVARRLEEIEPPRLAALAYHWDKAGDAQKTLYYAQAAGQRALREGAWAEARRFLTRTLELLLELGAPAEDIATCHESLCATAYGLGDLQAVKHHAHQIISPPQSKVALIRQTLVRGAKLYFTLRRPPHIVEEITAAELATTRAWSHLGGVYWFNNRGLLTLHALIQALRTAAPLGESLEQAAACTQLGAGLGFSGLHRAGAWLMRQGRQMAAALDDLPTVAYGHMFEGIYRTGLGQWPDAQAHIDRAQSIYQPVGDLYGWSNCQVVRFWCHLYQGQDAQAREAIDALLQAARRTGNRQHEMWALRSGAILALRRGASKAALKDLHRALELADSPRRAERVPTLGGLALAHMRDDDHPLALARIREAIDAARGRRPTSHALLEGCSAVVQVIQVALVEGWLEAAGGDPSLRKQALGLMRRYAKAFPIGEARWHLWRGVDAHRRGKRAQARRAWQLGVHAAQRMGMRADLEALHGLISGEITEYREILRRG